MLMNSNALKHMVGDVASWFKSKGWCQCCSTPTDPTSIVDAKMPKLKLDLENSIQNARDKEDLMREIDHINMRLDRHKEAAIMGGNIINNGTHNDV